MSPTAPLHVRHKTASPKEPLSRPDAKAVIAATSSLRSSYTPADDAVDRLIVVSPGQICAPTLFSSDAAPAPLSPRPQGPRYPSARAQATAIGLGSSHTRLRVVSGSGRRISESRETIPLKGEDGSPKSNPPTIQILNKRQHSEDQLPPRKRSPSRSPLEPRFMDPPPIIPHPSKVPPLSKRLSERRSSGRKAPRSSSGPLSNTRLISSANASLVSIATDSITENSAVKPVADANAVIEAARLKVSSAPSNAYIRLLNLVLR